MGGGGAGMTTEAAIEHVKVICAPPGSVLVFVVNDCASQIEVEHANAALAKALPQYQVLVMLGLEDIYAIVPENPPPIVNNYNTYNSTPAEVIR
jgi:hypothetical protein